MTKIISFCLILIIGFISVCCIILFASLSNDVEDHRKPNPNSNNLQTFQLNHNTLHQPKQDRKIHSQLETFKAKAQQKNLSFDFNDYSLENFTKLSREVELPSKVSSDFNEVFKKLDTYVIYLTNKYPSHSKRDFTREANVIIYGPVMEHMNDLNKQQKTLDIKDSELFEKYQNEAKKELLNNLRYPLTCKYIDLSESPPRTEIGEISVDGYNPKTENCI